MRRQLGERLRRLRESAGKTHADVFAAKIASPNKMWTIEKGRQPFVRPTLGPSAVGLCHIEIFDWRLTDPLMNPFQEVECLAEAGEPATAALPSAPGPPANSAIFFRNGF